MIAAIPTHLQNIFSFEGRWRRSQDDLLLYDLQPDRELHTTSNVKVPVIVPTKEHGDIRVALGVFLLECNYCHDVVKLGCCSRVFWISCFTAKTTQYLPSLFCATHLKEPSWAFWHDRQERLYIPVSQLTKVRKDCLPRMRVGEEFGRQEGTKKYSQ